MKKSHLCLAISFALLTACSSDTETISCPKGTKIIIQNDVEKCVFDPSYKVEKVEGMETFPKDTHDKEESSNVDIESTPIKSKMPDVISYVNKKDEAVVLKDNPSSKPTPIIKPKTVEKEKPSLLKDDKLNVSSNKDETFVEIPQQEEIEKLESKMRVKVKSGDTILNILSDNHISNTFFYSLSKENQKLITNLKVGEELDIEYKDGELISLSKPVSLLRTLVMSKSDKGYELKYDEKEPILSTNVYNVTINNSLYIDGKREGLSDYSILKIQKILGEKIDFVYEIRKGDAFSIMVERPTFDGKLAGTPKVLGVRFKSKIHGDIYALRYKNALGDVGYFDQNGKSVKTGFLRTPIDFTRISSNFNPNRRHPVLGYVRAHKGTDFAAPIGTPIYAASKGRVSKAGWGTGYGKVVYINHGNGISTRYAHMSRIKAKSGQYVKQGEVIGYVGVTGNVSGPHLHYEFRKHGNAIDAMKVQLPTSDPVPKKEMANFNSSISNVIAGLSSLDNTDMIALSEAEDKNKS